MYLNLISLSYNPQPTSLDGKVVSESSKIRTPDSQRKTFARITQGIRS